MHSRKVLSVYHVNSQLKEELRRMVHLSLVLIDILQGQHKMLVRFVQPTSRPIFAAVMSHRQLFIGTGAGGSGDGGWRGGSWRSFGASAAMAAAAASTSALCAPQDDVKKEQVLGGHLIDTLTPIMQQISIGSLMGYSCGYALRMVGRLAAFGVGVVFMAVQGASYGGYIDVNWKKTTTDLKKLINADGNGEVDADDLKIILNKFIEVCTYNLPSGTGFTGGLALGLGFAGGTAGKAAVVVGTASLIPRVLMMGGAATAGSGVMVTVKEQYDVARLTASKALSSYSSSSGLSEEAAFVLSLQAKDLEGLRELEKASRKQMAEVRDQGEKDKLAARLVGIEARKKALKKGM